MRSWVATILALSTCTSALPAIANSHLSAVPVQQKANFENVASHNFTQRSLDLAKQIPNEAIGLLMVDVDRRSWQVLDALKIPIQSPVFALDKLLQTLTDSSDFSLAQDLQPWIGKEVAIAFLSKNLGASLGKSSETTSNKGELVFAALSPVADDKQFELFMVKLKSRNLSKSTESTYQNVKIWEWQLEDKADSTQPEVSKKSASRKALTLLQRIKQVSPAPKNPNVDQEEPEELQEIPPIQSNFGFKRMAIAKLPNGVAVIASDRMAIEQMIDLANLSNNSELKLLSLADSPLFLRSLNNPLWNRSLIAGYGDFKEIGKFTEALAADLPETSDIPGFSRAEYIQSLKYTLAQYNSFDLFTWITPKGLRSQSSSYFTERRSAQPKDMQSRDRLLSLLPSNIYGSISSRNLNRQWQWFVEESKVQPIYKIFVDGLRMASPFILGSGLDLDIEKDIISWMDGEYAVVAFPSDRSPFRERGIDLTMGMLIRTSKPEAAKATLDKLTKYFNNLDKDVLQVKKRQVGNTLLTSFEFPDQREAGKTQSFFAYGWRDRQTLMLTLGSDTAPAFLPTPKPSLAESEMFRDAIADMPQPNFGYFYLDANAIAKLGFKFFVGEFMPSLDEPDQPPKTDAGLSRNIQKALDKLGGMVFVYSETSDRFQSDFFLRLNP